MSNSYRPRGFGGFSFFPPVLKNLLIITGIVFFLQIILRNTVIGGVNGEQAIFELFALYPIGYNFQIWQLVTYIFLHGSFSHILFNMFALWMFGMEIENAWGSKKFLYYYFICGIAAGLFQLFISPLLGAGLAPTIGASGAVYGVLIAFGMLFPDRPIYLYFLFPIKAKYLIGFLIILEFLLIDSAGSNVAHLAHLGGALAGFLFIMFDKSIDSPVKRMITGKTYYSRKSDSNIFSDFTDRFKSTKKDVEEAKFYDVNEKKKDEVTQEEIDRILDKISQSGYQNLTEEEKRILFEASKKMK